MSTFSLVFLLLLCWSKTRLGDDWALHWSIPCSHGKVSDGKCTYCQWETMSFCFFPLKNTQKVCAIFSTFLLKPCEDRKLGEFTQQGSFTSSHWGIVLVRMSAVGMYWIDLNHYMTACFVFCTDYSILNVVCFIFNLCFSTFNSCFQFVFVFHDEEPRMHKLD